MELSSFYIGNLYLDESFYQYFKSEESDLSMNLSMSESDKLKKIERIGYYDLSNEPMNSYEKTLTFYIIRHIQDSCVHYDYNSWVNFSLFYGINFDVIEKLINDCSDSSFRFVLFDNEILDMNINKDELSIVCDLFLYMQVIEDLNNISQDNSKESLHLNKYIYRDMSNSLILLNMDISKREFVDIGYFTNKLIPQTNSLNNIEAIYKFLCSIEIASFEEHKDTLENLYKTYNNDVEVHANMLFLMLSLQVIEKSPLSNTTSVEISKKIFDIFIVIFKDSKIIDIFKNNRCLNSNKAYSTRNANDNTTRLQILYEYNNGDQYDLRLDFAHVGISSFHINNKSKGQVDYFPLDQSLYDEITLINPEYENWFIEYNNNNKFFLRDKFNKTINKKQTSHNQLKELLLSNQHFTMSEFTNEEDMICIIEMWLNFFTTAGKDMPKEKLDPKFIYIERSLYNFTEEYCYNNLKEDFDESEFKMDMFRSFYKTEFIDIDEILSLRHDEINFIIEYAHEKLNDIRNCENKGYTGL